MKILPVVHAAITMIIEGFGRLWFYLFDHYVLYPLMRKIGRTHGIEFMNLGYEPAAWETELMKQTSSIQDPASRAHYLLYEKSLSMCPRYPRLAVELVDVGCGLGGGVRGMKTVHPELVKIVGIDKCVSSERGQLMIEGDAENLPLAAGSVGLIVNVESSHLYSDPQRFFVEANRVLRPGGFLCWADLRPADQASEPFAQAERAGFRLVAYEQINDRIVAGIHVTAAHYDQKLKECPFFIRFFARTLRTTYCAPGTETYESLRRGLKLYYTACWRKE